MRSSAPLLTLAFVAVIVGCDENSQAPTAPDTQPALDLNATAALAFRQVSAGHEHTCGVTPENRAYCWGRNDQGELGDGTTTDRLSPVAVAGGLRFRQVSAGFPASCGVTVDYRAYCWGANELGELGDGTTDQRLRPVAVAGGHRFRQVSTKFEHTCGLSYPDNRAYCWGENEHGALGNGTRTGPQMGNYGPYSSKPVAVARALSYHQMSVGYYHTCGVTTDDFLFCWGYNRDGQVGDGVSGWYRLKPSLIKAPRRFLQVDAGRDYTCAVARNARAFCWGNGSFGKLGNGSLAEYHVPTAVAGGLSFERVTTGAFHACGETTLNVAYCWGSNGLGSVGDGTRTDRSIPTAVTGGLRFSEVSAGGFHTCGRTPDAVAYCWGDGFAGQLGDGTTISKTEPAPVGGGM